MSIESALERIAAALEAIAGRAQQRSPSKESEIDITTPVLPPEPEEAPAPKKAKKVKEEAAKDATVEDIAAALRTFVTAKGKDQAVAILKKYGAARLSEIKPGDFSKVLADLKV